MHPLVSLELTRIRTEELLAEAAAARRFRVETPRTRIRWPRPTWRRRAVVAATPQPCVEAN